MGVISRFKVASSQLPEGVKLLSRWTAADLSGGFDLLDCAELSLMWSDLTELKIVPGIEDT